MISSKAIAIEPLRRDSIQQALKSSGPCLTVLLPPYHPGAQEQSTATLLNTIIQDATRQLRDRNLPQPEIANLLDPLREMAKDPDLLGGSHWGRVVLRSPEVFRQFHLTETARESLTVAGCFNIRPILSELQLPPEFYVLKLSRKCVGLVRCADFRVEPIPLPKGTPETLEEMLAFEPPDHDLENRATAGSSAGARRGIRFGTGSGRETQQTYVADFYKVVDHGVHELLHGRKAPLALLGVEEDTALYQSINTYPDLLAQSIPGSPDGLHETDILRQSYAVIRAASVERALKELAESRERVAPERFSTALDTILPAAFDGRVHRLYIEEAARQPGTFHTDSKREYRSWGEEDLFNLAAVETTVQGGQAFAIPDRRMPTPVAALFRF